MLRAFAVFEMMVTGAQSNDARARSSPVASPPSRAFGDGSAMSLVKRQLEALALRRPRHVQELETGGERVRAIHG